MKPIKNFCAALAALLPMLAAAHTGHEHGSSGFAAGLMHPLSGLDHVLLAFGLGLLLYRGVKHGGILGGLCLSTALVVGFALSLAYALPTQFVEAGILASVVLTLVALYWGKKSVGLLSLGALAVFHGMAHGLEMPASTSAFGFMLGMVASMLAVYAAAWAVGRWLLSNLPTSLKQHYIVEKVLAVFGMGALLLG